MSGCAIRALSATVCLLLTVLVQLAWAESKLKPVSPANQEKKHQTVESQSKPVVATDEAKQRKTMESQSKAGTVAFEDKKRQTNQIAVTIVVSGLSCTCAQFAEDIRNVVNDLRPDGQRVLPVFGVGGLQNLEDLLFLDDIDMAVVDEDNLRLLKKRDPALYANVEQRVQYITKLYNSEFQVIARDEIKTFEDLRGKKVNFSLKNSETEVAADIVFNTLKLDTVRSYYDNDAAIKKVIDGEIAAMIVLTGVPQPMFAKLKREDGVHFLPFDGGLERSDVKQILADYLPTELTHEQYPVLIPEGQTVPTFATGTLLVAYAWPEDSERYKKVAKFVHEFFDRIDRFHDSARHPRWSEVNLAAKMPDWTRFKPAADWLAEHRAAAEGGAELRLAFDKFVNQYAAARGLKTIPASDREMLFVKFRQSLQSQAANPSR
jgi:TRAP transporter TAXI family solute receptor